MDNLLLVHGWAFDADFWDPWVQIFPEWKTAHRYDRGYFGSPQTFPETEKFKWIICHSYGWHWVRQSWLNQAEGIILINSFQSIHPSDESGKRRSKRVLSRMITQFEKSPESVLMQFYQRCGCTHDQPKIRNVERLKNDLIEMNMKETSLEIPSSLQKILIFHSTQDVIAGNATFLVHPKVVNHSIHAQHYLYSDQIKEIRPYVSEIQFLG